jgi:hypothetical protein
MQQLGGLVQSSTGFGQLRAGARALSVCPLRQQQQQQRRGRHRCQCQAQYDANWSSTVDTQTMSKRAALSEYVSMVEPSLIEKFGEQAPATVVDAMRTTVRGSLGTLPPQFFNVQISSRADSFAQLLYSHAMAGYMFRNALFRMELRGALILPVLPAGDGGGTADGKLAAAAEEEALDLWAPGTQTTRVQGEVLRWHLERGPQAIPAAQYIQDLEAEIRSLKQQVASVRLTGSSPNNNELLDYIQSLGKDSELLTANASQEVLDSMTAFIDRCMGSNQLSDLQAITEYNVQELAPQLMWTIIVGYMMRSLEVRYDIQSSLDELDHPIKDY